MAEVEKEVSMPANAKKSLWLIILPLYQTRTGVVEASTQVRLRDLRSRILANGPVGNLGEGR